MKTLFLMFVLIGIQLTASNVEINPVIGNAVDFSSNSIKIFNKYFKLDSEYVLRDEEEQKMIDKQYGSLSKYGSFYDDLKSSIWEVFGEADINSRYDPFPYKITSSSFLNNNSNYKPENLCDNSFKTAWVEGAKDYGIGEYFEYYINKYKFFKENEFNEEIEAFIPTIHEIHLFNGYVKSEKAFKENSRIKKLKMYVDGKPWAILELVDTTSQQIFEIPEINYLKVKNRKDYKEDLILKFEILEVYPGNKYQDTCLTELLLYTYDRL